MDRYSRNLTTISEEENNIIKKSKVCVIGCGGLGGYSIEMLGRIGVGNITAVDGDVFDETNLNRQILSNTSTLGMSKAYVAMERMKLVNEEIQIKPIQDFLDETNANKIIKGNQVVVDALDHIPTRLLVQKTCEELNIPFVYGAIAGWYGQVSTIFPGDRTLNKIYKKNISKGEEKKLGNPSFTPALISSIQVSEVIKILIKRGELLRNRILYCDTLNQEYQIIDI